MSTAFGRRSDYTATNPEAAPLLTIIGAGPAGVATGYFAQKAGLSFRILEAGNQVGGNAATLEHNGFRYDTGAHRWHDRYPEITAELKALLQEDLMQIEAPSQIFSQGRFFDFPLTPLNLLRNLGLWATAIAVAQVLGQCLKPAGQPASGFSQMAIRRYGTMLASRFLLGYSEKLWGAPVSQLSEQVAGKRLRGLSLKTFIIEALQGRKAKTTHLDGSFYYPKYGIGTITSQMAASLAPGCLWFDQRVTRVRHHLGQITHIQARNEPELPVQDLVSTLPLTGLLKALDPPPPAEVLQMASSLQFRHLLLVVLFLNRESVTPNASVYFPDPELPFTRLYEPRNRSSFMAPKGQTSVVVEIPASLDSPYWKKTDEELVKDTVRQLARMGFISADQLLEGKVHRVPYAYPVLLQDSEPKVAALLEYLRSFRNLHLAGRTATFAYSHLHDHFRQAARLVENFKNRGFAAEQIRRQVG